MLTNDGQKPNTVRHTRYKLQEIAAHVDLFDPEAVKHGLTTATSEKTADNMVEFNPSNPIFVL
jgi:hypothetical protein